MNDDSTSRDDHDENEDENEDEDEDDGCRLTPTTYHLLFENNKGEPATAALGPRPEGSRTGSLCRQRGRHLSEQVN